MPLPGVLEGANLRSTTLVKDDPLTITKPAGLLRWRRGPFWVSFEVDSVPTRPFSLILDGLQCGGKRIELPRIDFREGTEHRTEYQYQEYSFFLWEYVDSQFSAFVPIREIRVSVPTQAKPEPGKSVTL